MELKGFLIGILWLYLFPILLMAFGILLALIGLISRDEQTKRAWVATDWMELGPLRRVPRPELPRWLRFALLIGGVGLIAIGVLFVGLGYRTSSMLATSPSLISLSYKAEDWDPRMVDLRAASSSGIPVSSGQSLQFFDLWIAVPEDAPEYTVQAEIRANDQRIGSTSAIPLIADKAHPGTTQLGDVTIEKFNHDTVSKAWRVQPDWSDLEIVLATYRNDQMITSTHTTIHLSTSGTAWLIGPPNANFASIVYAINDGSEVVMDFRDVGETGLGVKPGDKLTLLEVWYDSNASGGNSYTMKFEAYLSSGKYDPDTIQISKPNVIQKGTYKFADFTPISWIIPVGKELLVASLCRNDRTVMDRLELPLGLRGSPGLVRRSDAVLWPFGKVKYVDFESPADPDEWTGTEFATVTQSSGQAFTGGYALAVTTTGMGDTEESKILTHWKHPFQAEVIVGQVYWPRQESVKLIWAQACAWACVSIPRELEQWNTFVMDLSELTVDDKPLNTVELPELWIQAKMEGVDKGNPYTFYVDGIQLYPVSQR